MTAGRAKRVILHIGAPKAGSTAIQAMLGRNRGIFAAHGVRMPMLGSGATASALVPTFVPWPRTTALHRKFNLKGPLSRRRHEHAIREKLARELDATRPDTVVLSSEHFYEHVTGAGSIARLRSLLMEIAGEITVIGWFRRQDQAMFSSQLHSARVGGNALFLPPSSVTRNHWLCYAERLVCWSRVFRDDEVIIRPYEPSGFPDGDICRDFLTRTGLAHVPVETGFAANLGLDLVSAAYLERLNERIPRFIGKKCNPVYDAIASAISKLPERAARPRISAADARHVLSLFRESNTRLDLEFGGGGPFFDPAVNEADPLADDGLCVEDALAISGEIFENLAEKIQTLQNANQQLRKRLGEKGTKAPGEIS
jgi:hypothetical protein